MTRFHIAIAVTGFGLALALPAQALSPEEAVAAAEQHEKDGSFRKAITIYEGFLKQYPEHIQRRTVLYRIGICHDNVGEIPEATAAFSKVIAAGAERSFKHRADAHMKLAKLLGEATRHEDGIKVLKSLLSEGAGVYEDEAQVLCAGFYAMTGRPDEAAVMFNVIKNRPQSPLAEEAAYKVAIVWMKAEQTELARKSVEEFALRYPTQTRTVELYLRLGRYLFERKQYKSATSVCSQVQRQYGDRPEAAEAAFIIALCYRDTDHIDQAVVSLRELAVTASRVRNGVLASEAWFEMAEITRKQKQDMETALEYYRSAAESARRPITQRQQLILEHSLYRLAEHAYETEHWSGALDLYLQLRESGSKMNVLGRILHCRSKLDEQGEASLGGETEDERRFLEERIAANPNSLIALQSELHLLDKKLEGLGTRGGPVSKAVIDLIASYQGLLTKYPAEVLAVQDLQTYIRMRIGYASSILTPLSEVPDLEAKWRVGLDAYETALRDSPDTLFQIDILEGIAVLAGALKESRKAFDAYQKLYELAGEAMDAAGQTPDDETRSSRPPEEYLAGMTSIADTGTMVQDAIVMLYKIILDGPLQSSKVRAAQFHLAELLYVKKQYSEAAREYRLYVTRYGPPLDENRKLIPSWTPPTAPDPILQRAYEAGIRVAHCWFAQGHKQKMQEAYEWVVANQRHQNPHQAEALYFTIMAQPQTSIEEKRGVAESLFAQLVNTSTDFGSKAFGQSFMFWVEDPRAVPYVKSAILTSGDLLGRIGRHAQAAEVFKQYLEIYSPKKVDASSKKPRFMRDEQYDTAEYATGRELIEAGDYESMVDIYRPSIDGLRDRRFRASILLLLGHYGTAGELYDDAREAYAALLDEYGEPNPLDEDGKSIPIPADQRLRPASTWNGVRRTPPDNWDPGEIRQSLGYLFWKKHDSQNCRLALEPFMTDPGLREHASRAEALLMLARANINLKDDAAAIPVLERMLADHPKFDAGDEAYVDLLKACYRTHNWTALNTHYERFTSQRPGAARRPYLDLYDALAQIAQGQTATGIPKLRTLANAETYADLKADAHYHLAMHTLTSTPPDRKAAYKLLKKSIEYYPRAAPLLEAGRCAVELSQWDDAREYLDRCMREFPQSDETILKDARQLMTRVAEAKANP
ncbi:MAG: tetratricopeptide repeat protein [Verrucomicrobia bacterium]|nr:tetratricopeptide repeat protein [Verrucomicrobiota bacterium]